MATWTETCVMSCSAGFGVTFVKQICPIRGERFLRHSYPASCHCDNLRQFAACNARPRLGTMLRTALLPSGGRQVAGETSARRPRQRLCCSSINRSLPLAVVPTNASINDRLRCISSTLHPKHSVQKRGSQRAKITTKALCISSQQRNSTDGSGKRQHQRTVCQASRASMSDSLEEVRAAVTLPKLSKHRSPLSVLLQRRWDFVTALQPCFVSLLTSLKQRH